MIGVGVRLAGCHGSRVALFGKVDARTGKLDAITTALHELRGAAGPSIKDVLIIIATCAAQFSPVSGGIIYLAGGPIARRCTSWSYGSSVSRRCSP